jgi:hypothetical protein
MRTLQLFVLLVSLFFTNCKPTEDKPSKAGLSAQQKQKIEKPFGNAVLIYGSDAGHFFQIMYKQNNPALMHFISSLTLSKFSQKRISNYLARDFPFDFNLGPITTILNVGDTIQLIYSKAQIYGTRRKIVISCRNENDTIKLILFNLGRHPFQTENK